MPERKAMQRDLVWMLLLLGACGLVAWMVFEQSAFGRDAGAARARMADSSARLLQTQRLEDVVVRMENHQRGWLLHEDPVQRTRRDALARDSLALVAGVRARTRPDERATVAALERWVQARVAQYAAQDALVRQGRIDAARAHARAGDARAMDSLHAFGEALRSRETARLARARVQADAAQRRFDARLPALAVVALLLIAIAGVVGGWQLAAQRRIAAGLLQAQARANAVVHTALDGFISMDGQGRVVEWTPQAAAIFGWSQEEAAGQRLSDLVIPPAMREAHEKGLRHYLATGEGPVLRKRIEVEGLHRDGHCIPIELSIWPQVGGPAPLFNAFLRDISERRAAQQRIESLNAQLEQHAGDLERHNEELALRTRAAEDANRDLEAFCYSISHDLRAPLRHMSGYAQILQEDAAGKLEPGEQRSLQQIIAAGRRMGALIDDLLAFARLGRVNVAPMDVPMRGLVESVLSEVRADLNPLAQVEVGDLPNAPGDPALLRQVWANLLSNALKYSAPRGADARITVEGVSRPGWVRYSVRDNGVGFDMQYAGKLFGVFQRLHSQDRFEGTGVGLAIVQRILQRHGGHAHADAALDQGATFTIELPSREAS